MAIAATVPSTESSSRGLHIALWVVQVLLAVAFGMAGVMKTTTPIAVLAEKMAWVSSAGGLVRFIGASELAAAIGLILPSATRIRPGLTPLAAAGLVLIMILAMPVHIARGEFSALPINLALGGLAAFVAWGRTRRAPILPR